MRGLLRQDATSDMWDRRNADARNPDGTFYLAWEPKSSAHIREALEYGTYQGSSTDH